jgi:hypothetical protein
MKGLPFTAAVAPAAATAAVAATAAAKAAAANTAEKVRKRATTGAAADPVFTSGEKSAATAADVNVIGGAAAVAAGATPFSTAIRTSEPPATRPTYGRLDDRRQATAAAAAGDHQRRVAWADHEAPTTSSTATTSIAANAADGDLQNLVCGQAEIAADFGTSTACAEPQGTASALCAKGEDLIGRGGRHHEGDEATGVGEDEWHGAGGRSRRSYRHKHRSTQQKLFHFGSPRRNQDTADFAT